MKKKSPSSYAMRAGMQGFTLAWASSAMPTVEGGGEHRVARSAHDVCQATEHMEKVCAMRSHPLLVGACTEMQGTMGSPGANKTTPKLKNGKVDRM